MLKRLPPGRATKLLAAAAEHPRSDPRVSYPGWYLHRWHFLPEGYLSRRSAAGYDHLIRRVYNQGREGAVIRALLSEIAVVRPESLLEVGVGPGRFLQAAARTEAAGLLAGVDLSPYLLERARRRVTGKARLMHADGLALPSEDCSFDAVVAAHYIGHLPADVRQSAVEELARVVRPGGHVFIVDHHWHGQRTPENLECVRKRRLNAGLIDIKVFERQAEEAG